MVPKKSQSKRQTLKMKYKIQKRVSQHNKKMKKLNKKTTTKKTPMDTVPKMMPNRESIIENLKNRKPLITITEKLPVPEAEEIEATTKSFGQSTVYKAIDASEAVVQLLDARCPDAFRNKSVEAYCKKQQKPMIFVYTKTDLAQQSTVDLWKAQHKVPCFAVKCNTQQQSKHLSRQGGHKSAVGIPPLYQHLIKYRTVVFIGCPSVGKSSLINSLTSERVSTSGKNDGTTKGIMKIAVTKKLTIFDTPGVYPNGENMVLDILQNRNVEQLYAWFKTEGLLAKLVMALGVQHPDTLDDMIVQVAKKHQFMNKGKLDWHRSFEFILKKFREGSFWACVPSAKGYSLYDDAMMEQ